MDLPLVSIVCNCYNHAPYVLEAIQSVQQQTYKNIELIVLDNGSTDDSLHIIRDYLKDFPEVRFIYLDEPLSLPKAFNTMFKYTNGDFLIDLSADDVLLTDCVQKQIDFFQKQDDSTGIVFGNAYLIDENGQNPTPFFDVDNEGKVLDSRLHSFDYYLMLHSGKTFCSVSAMMRRTHFIALNGYDESLFFEDLDYWYRLSRRFRIRFIDDFLVKKRQLNHSLGAQIDAKGKHTHLLNLSLIKIYRSAISYNSPKENKALLQRIHYSMSVCFQHRLWADLLRFTYLKFLCQVHCLFR